MPPQRRFPPHWTLAKHDGLYGLIAVTALAFAWLLLLIALTPHYATSMVGDEAKYLVIARYLGTGISIGEFAEAMRGYPIMLWLLALPFGGLGALSLATAHDLARALNLSLTTAVVPLSYGALRLSGAGMRQALLGAAAVVSYPLFIIFTPLAMTEVSFAALAIVFAVAAVLWLIPTGSAIAITTVGLSALALVSVKAVGSYCVVISALACCLLHRFRPRALVLLAIALTCAIAARLTGLTFDYSVHLFRWQHIVTVIPVGIIGIAAALLVSLITIAPLLSASLKPRALDLAVIAVFGFLLPTIVVSSAFHGLIERLTNYRTVAAVMPLLILAAVACAERSPGRMRAAAVIAIGAAWLGIRAFRGLYILDNTGDFLTVLPLFYVLYDSLLSLWTLVFAGIIAALASLALLRGVLPRVAGVVFLNLLLIWLFMPTEWPADGARRADFAAGQKIADEVLARRPPRILLAEDAADRQWATLATPYAWAAMPAVTLARFLPGHDNHAIEGGIAVTRRPMLNAQPIVEAHGGNTSFFAYDLDRAILHDADLAIDEMIERGNARNMNHVERMPDYTLAFARLGAAFGPLLVPAQGLHMTIRAVPAEAADRFLHCELVSGTQRWRFENVNPPTATQRFWILTTTVTPQRPFIGQLRLSCEKSGIHPASHAAVTLPIARVVIRPIN
jgi:hypothetical protein